MTGTSTNTPTTVASAVPDESPNRLMATATASSKTLDVRIIQADLSQSIGRVSLDHLNPEIVFRFRTRIK